MSGLQPPSMDLPFLVPLPVVGGPAAELRPDRDLVHVDLPCMRDRNADHARVDGRREGVCGRLVADHLEAPDLIAREVALDPLKEEPAGLCDLNTKIRAFIDGWTTAPNPSWTKTAEQVLAKAIQPLQIRSTRLEDGPTVGGVVPLHSEYLGLPVRGALACLRHSSSASASRHTSTELIRSGSTESAVMAM